jgi:hypothetical protein
MQRQRRHDGAIAAGRPAVTDFGALEHCDPEKACSDNTEPDNTDPGNTVTGIKSKSHNNLNTSIPHPASRPMTVQPGCLVRIHGRADAHAADALYEVVTVEEDDLRCWVRRWPHPRRTTAAFAVPLSQLEGPLQLEARP